MDLRIVNNVVSYHGLSGHCTCSQGFIEWACIIAEFSNSTRTNSFHAVSGKAVARVRKAAKFASQGDVHIRCPNEIPVLSPVYIYIYIYTHT